MLTKIAIENFKGIGERVELDLAPITLLFGANSAGKSSIIHALHYAREVLLKHNIDVNQTETGGEYIKLGGFYNLVHGRKRWCSSDNTDATPSVSIELTSDVSELLLSDYFGKYEKNEGTFHPNFNAWMEVEKENNTNSASRCGLLLCKYFNSISIKLNTCMYSNGEKGLIESFSIYIDGIDILEIEHEFSNSNEERFYSLKSFNFDHPILPNRLWSSEVSPNNDLPRIPEDWNDHIKWSHKYEALGLKTPENKDVYNKERYETITRRDHLTDEWQHFHHLNEVKRELLPEWKSLAEEVLNIVKSTECFDADYDMSCKFYELFELLNSQQYHKYDQFVNFISTNDMENVVNDNLARGALNKIEMYSTVKEYSEALSMSYNVMQYYTNLFICIALGSIKHELQSFRYLGPVRKIKDNNNIIPGYIDPSRWPTGLAAWDSLLGQKHLVNIVNDWISDPEKLNLGYKVVRKVFKRVEMEKFSKQLEDKLKITNYTLSTEEFIKIINDIYEEVPDDVELCLRSITDSHSIDLKSNDVGVGVGQVIPVIVAIMDADFTILAIEQPELHLHPKQQTLLGDLLIKGVLESEGKYNTHLFLYGDMRHLSKDSKMLFVETHSEHLILRLLRRIRESSQGKLPTDFPDFKPEDIAVHYVEQTTKGTKVKRLRINEEGEFIDRWPNGFFEERAEELF